MIARFVRAILPREEPFVANFTAHARCLVDAAAALRDLMNAAPSERPAFFDLICTIEGRADGIAREVLLALHRAFLTPFDRSSIHALITAQDDAVDLIEDSVQRAALYKVTEFSPAMMELGSQIARCADLLAEAIPLLANVSANAERILAVCDKVGKIEGEADRTLRMALADLFDQNPAAVPLIARKEIYELLEEVTDRCDDVADLIEGIVLDHV
jgi:uncharacterized protein